MRRRRAFTILEVIVSLAVMSLMLVTALHMMGSANAARVSQRWRSEAAARGHELMAEIMQAAYADPDGGTGIGLDGGESPSSRSTWDDVDDFHGWSSSPPKRADGEALAGLAGWTRSVTVQAVEDVVAVDGRRSLVTGGASIDTGLRLVRVTVESPGGFTHVVSAVRADYAALEIAPILDTEYVTCVGVDLQLAGHGPLGTAVGPYNQRPPPPPDAGGGP